MMQNGIWNHLPAKFAPGPKAIKWPELLRKQADSWFFSDAYHPLRDEVDC
jgi:hypothetical protein